jgi:hypothetical protein
MSVKSMITGMLIASFVWALLLVAFIVEYEVPSPIEWEGGFTLKENPLTQDRRVVDNETQTTIFWVSGNPPIVPVEVKKIRSDRWQAIFERAQHER